MDWIESMLAMDCLSRHRRRPSLPAGFEGMQPPHRLLLQRTPQTLFPCTATTINPVSTALRDCYKGLPTAVSHIHQHCSQLLKLETVILIQQKRGSSNFSYCT